MEVDLHTKPWWNQLEPDLQSLFEQSVELTRRVKYWDQNFDDYSFIVFPAAKAYEGFLKNFFLDMGFITKEQYLGRKFRIGRALNPDLEKKYRIKEGVYDKLTKYCKSPDLSEKLWNTWKESRNKLFHWFANEANIVSYPEAKERIEMIVDSIDSVYDACDII